MGYTFASATILLLLITDPFGNIPIFANALKNVPPEGFLRLMNLSALSLQIAGGVILFLIALRMIFPAPLPPEDALIPISEPLIVPLAVPALAGPSALATVLLLVSQAPERRWEWIAALSVTMAVCAVVLVLAERIQRLLGERFVVAVERLMGLILVAVSVEMLLGGVKAFVKQLH